MLRILSAGKTPTAGELELFMDVWRTAPLPTLTMEPHAVAELILFRLVPWLLIAPLATQTWALPATGDQALILRVAQLFLKSLVAALATLITAAFAAGELAAWVQAPWYALVDTSGVPSLHAATRIAPLATRTLEKHVFVEFQPWAWVP